MRVKFSKARKTIRMANAFLKNSSFDELKNKLLGNLFPKQDHEFMGYQHSEHTARRSPDNDRVFPLETVSLIEFNTNHQSNLDTAIIHTGPYANELAMRMNALAIVLGEDIFFRNGAYRPETEEGRKIIAHELTHVSQYQEGELTPNTTREKLEAEAELAESRTIYDADPYEPYPVGNKVYYIRRSQREKVTKLAADGVEEWLKEQKHVLAEEKYQRLLSTYNNLLNERV